MAIEESFLPLDVAALTRRTGNVYKSVAVMSKRADQITVKIKEELSKKLAEFAPAHDNLEEIIENREQIEISKYYEAKPKPLQVSIKEFGVGDVYFRNPHNPEETNAPDAEK